MVTHAEPAVDRRVNLYEVLQVSPRASQEVVQAAYRALARTYHPDVNATSEAARQMKQLNMAYRVLSDTARRARYDALRGRPMRAHNQPARDSAQPHPARPTAATPRPSYIRAVPSGPITPLPRGTGPRLSRVLGGLCLLLFILGSLVYGLWLVAGALEDEPMRAMIPTQPDVAQMTTLSNPDPLNRVSTEH